MVNTLKGMSLTDYQKLKSTGMMWEFHPEATGNWKEDTGNEKTNISITNDTHNRVRRGAASRGT